MTEKEFQAAFEEHKDAVYRFAWRMMNSPATAEDVAQDVFLALLRRPGRFDPSRGTPQDFRAEDGVLDLSTPYVTVNGQLGASAIPTGIVASGASVWLYLPMYGRLILSLVPYPQLGFVKAGEVRGSTMNFTMGSDMFSIVSARRIAPGRRPFNLYVLHEPGWLPPDGNASIWGGGAADHPDQLIVR